MITKQTIKNDIQKAQIYLKHAIKQLNGGKLDDAQIFLDDATWHSMIAKRNLHQMVHG